MHEDNLEPVQPEPEPEVVFAEGYEVYLKALLKAWGELDQIKETKKQLAYRESKLNETVAALKPLVFKQTWDINMLTLSDAIRFVFSSAKRSLTAVAVRTKLEDLDYNLSQFDNPLATIHTALKRMGDTNELVLVENDDKKKVFEPGPDLKTVAEPESGMPSYSDVMGLLGENTAGEK
jgi:hypothetical protein